MAKKKSVKIVKKRKISRKKTNSFEREIIKDVREVENWVIQRRKFFIKLFWVFVFVAILWIISDSLFKA